VIVVTEATQLAGCRAELPELDEKDFIVEPARRGTAACLALAAASLDPDEVMLSLHADHLIPDATAFARSARALLELVAAGEVLGTLGIKPRSPSTAFGYIEKGEEVSPGAWRVRSFVEKPPRAEAERMLQGGGHLWNTGIFAWRCRVFQEELRTHSPAIAAAAATAAGFREQDPAAFGRAYLECPDLAVDHAVMEKTRRLLVVAADFAWSDVGSWGDVAGVLAPANANALLGDALVLQGEGNLVLGGDRLVALVGVSELVVVDTPDALLVCRRDDAQGVKEIVARLRELGRTDLL
jgi:mannose-1-phosphate guanylyltransferase/mannose-6-phosphate isomerase